MKLRHLLILFITILFASKTTAQTTSIFYHNEVKFAEVITDLDLKKGEGCYTRKRGNAPFQSGHVVYSWVTDTICGTNFSCQKIVGCGDYRFLIWHQWRDSVQADSDELLKDTTFSSPEEKEIYIKEHLRELIFTDKKMLPKALMQNVAIRNDSIWYDESNYKTLMYTSTKGSFYQEQYMEQDSSRILTNTVTGLGDTTIYWKGRKIDCFQFEYDDAVENDVIIGYEIPRYRLIKKEIVEKTSGMPIIVYEKYYRCKDYNECNDLLKKLKLFRTCYMYIYDIAPANQN